MRVLFIINCFSAGGGAETLLTQIVNGLPEEKYEIGIFEIIHNNIKTEPINKNIKMYPYYVEADDPNRKKKMYYVYNEWDKVIAQYIPSDYDLYVSFNYLKPSFLLPKGKKNISWIHGDIYNLLDKSMIEERILQNEAFRKANRIIAISDNTYNSIVEVCPEHKDKIEILYNGINIKKVREKSEESTDVVLKHPAVISVGRLDDNKNPLRLLKIFKDLIDSGYVSHLYYLGYGKLEAEIIDKINEYNLDGYVHLLGYFDNPFPIIKQADVIGMFSKSEGFPMALLEAITLSVPFVSSKIGGAMELSNNNMCGSVVDNDEEAVKELIKWINTSKREKEKSCEKCIHKFNFFNYLSKVDALFEKVVNENI